MWPEDSNNNYHIWTGNGGINGKVQLIAENKCGLGGSVNIDVIHDNSTPCTTCDNPITIYPNVAKNNFTIDLGGREDKTRSITI